MGKPRIKKFWGQRPQKSLRVTTGDQGAALWDVKLDDLNRAIAEVWLRDCKSDGIRIPAEVQRPCDTEGPA